MKLADVVFSWTGNIVIQGTVWMDFLNEATLYDFLHLLCCVCAEEPDQDARLDI